ncbi:MAG: hypothetical protein M3Z65_00735 [Chloroflexota bacterium]|nr:hypothetical protein [Chloroflexota bacterium]
MDALVQALWRPETLVAAALGYLLLTIGLKAMDEIARRDDQALSHEAATQH